MDRITDTDTRYVQLDGDWWNQTPPVYAQKNSSAATVVSTHRNRITGLGTDGRIAESKAMDIHGNITRARTRIHRATHTQSQVVDLPDAAIHPKTVNQYGLTTASTDQYGITTTFDYDDLGRRTAVTDPHTGRNADILTGLIFSISGKTLAVGR